MNLSRYVIASDPFGEEHAEDQRVIYSTRTGKRLLVRDEDWQRIKSDITCMTVEERQVFQSTGMLVSADVDELSEVLAENHLAIEAVNNIYLALQPTAQCQMGCSYCGQKHTNEKLTVENDDLIVGRLEQKIRLKKFDALEVSWFGAEPLLAMEEIERISLRLLEFCNRNGMRYSAKCITNGLRLNRKNYNRLSRLGVTYFEVTLDGDEEWHDARRDTKGHTPTFSRIINNLLELRTEGRSSGPEIGIRCNVDESNRQSVLPLLKHLRSLDLHAFISKIYFAAIHSWGNDAHKRLGNEDDHALWDIVWLAQAIQLGFKVGIIPERKQITCFALRHEAELIDAKGNIFNCSEVSYVPAYEISPDSDGMTNRWQIGGLGKGEVEGRRQILSSFNDIIENGDLPCASCEILPICGGSCPKMWLEGLIPCPTIKHNLPSRLGLEYLARTSELQQVNVNIEGILVPRTLPTRTIQITPI